LNASEKSADEINRM